MARTASPCSRRHGKFCSTEHAALMAEYWAERERLEMRYENELLKDWDAHDRPGSLQFKDWLIGSRGRNRYREE